MFRRGFFANYYLCEESAPQLATAPGEIFCQVGALKRAGLGALKRTSLALKRAGLGALKRTSLGGGGSEKSRFGGSEKSRFGGSEKSQFGGRWL